jgi:hypothetical protein
MARTAAKKPVRKKKTARKKTARGKKKAAPRKKKKVAAKKKAATTRKKKTAKKKAAKRRPAKTQARIPAQLEKRIERLTAQLGDLRRLVEKEVAEDLRNTRKYADKELELQKRRFDQIVERVKQENHELRSRLSKFVAEHEMLKDVTKGVSETAKTLEERVKNLISRES